MNLINSIPILFKKCINIEQHNLFCFIVLFFIIGTIAAFNRLEYFNFVVPKWVVILIFILFCSSLLLYMYMYYIVKINVLQTLLLLIIFFLLGFLIFCYKSFNNTTRLMNHNLNNVHLTGVVDKITHKVDSRFYTVFLSNIKIDNYNNLDTISNIRLITYYGSFLKRKDTITLWANLNNIDALHPFDISTQYNAFWKHISANGFVISRIEKIKKGNNKTSIFNITVKHVKQYLYHKINSNLSSKTAGIAQAIILGNYLNITAENWKYLINSGLSPFIAISGLHISLVTIFIFFVVRGLLSLIPQIALTINTKKVAAIVTIILLICYLILLDNIPSARRSGIIVILYMIGIICNFNTISIRNLFVAILLLLLFKPEYIGYPSFLLSFLATAIIINILNNKFISNAIKLCKQKLIFKILCYFSLTIVISLIVNLAVSPILIYYFNRVTIYATLSNLIITPLFSFCILPILYLSILIPEPLCWLPFKIVDLSIMIMLKVAEYVSELQTYNIGVVNFNINILFLYIIFLLVFIICSSKLKYLALILCACLYVYILITPFPHILIDKQMNLVAFFNINTNKYILNTLKGGSFIKKYWFNDPTKIENKSIRYNKAFKCDKIGNCYMNIKNFLVSYNSIEKYIKITGDNKQIINNNINTNKESIIINKDFLKNFGATFVYLSEPNKIKIISKKTVTTN